MSPRTFFRLFSHLQMLPILESGEETLVGGQAVLEGVMMRAPTSVAVVVRRRDGSILVRERHLSWLFFVFLDVLAQLGRLVARCNVDHVVHAQGCETIAVG